MIHPMAAAGVDTGRRLVEVERIHAWASRNRAGPAGDVGCAVEAIGIKKRLTAFAHVVARLLRCGTDAAGVSSTALGLRCVGYCTQRFLNVRHRSRGTNSTKFALAQHLRRSARSGCPVAALGWPRVSQYVRTTSEQPRQEIPKSKRQRWRRSPVASVSSDLRSLNPSRTHRSGRSEALYIAPCA